MKTGRCACVGLVALVAMGAGSRLEAAELGLAPEAAGQAQAPSPLPPEGSPPLLANVELRFPTQGNVSSVDSMTYLYHTEVQHHVSLPSQGKWVPYTEEIEDIILADFHRLWDTGFLNDLWIEVIDQAYDNGVLGKRVIYNFEERERVKIVTFEGSDEVGRGDIDTAMRENGLSIRLDSFLDLEMIRRTKGLLQFMFADKGYPFAEIDHELTKLAGGPRTVQLTFHMDEGPKVFVDEIGFVGNQAMSDRTLRGKMKNTKERWWLSRITGRGTYKEAQFEEDADRIIGYYRDEGYIDAQVGQPDLEYLEASEDGTRRDLQLRIPIEEGERYRIGEVDFDGNEVVTDIGLKQIFKNMEPGVYYSEDDARKGFEAARELYGALGYYEMTLFPDLQPRTRPAEDATGNGDGNGDGDGESSAAEWPMRIDGAPVVDVTIRVQEGDQYFVNRITFVGNETTHDHVIRRELQLVERGVFNTEGMKYSVRRLNQLGYFEPLDESDVEIAKLDGSDNEVDLTFNLTEASLNQLSFGAGMSQFDGFFGQLSFQTTNFLGRGETLAIGIQSGSRVRDINLTFTEPFLFNRNMSGSANVFSRRIEWIGSFTEESIGTTFTVGKPLALFTRLYMSYSYEESRVTDINPVFTGDVGLGSFSPFFQDALLLGTGGRRTISKVTPMLQMNTVDHPIFPSQGTSYSAGIDLAGLGGNTKFLKPTLEGLWYIPHTSRTTVALRAQYRFLSAGDPNQIPVFERLWLGGEYSVRGFDIRRIGPTVSDINPFRVNPETGEEEGVPEDTFQGRTIMGGNKSLLFNAEYQVTIAGPVRFVTFYDAGQVQDFGNRFALDGFKTSTGVELRFFMPMLNVPFRLIYAWNPQRDGVYTDRMQPQKETVFRFAVGTMF